MGNETLELIHERRKHKEFKRNNKTQFTGKSKKILGNDKIMQT